MLQGLTFHTSSENHGISGVPKLGKDLERRSATILVPDRGGYREVSLV
jgi:hypothetical protein